jgi:hypothetical protein
MKKKTAIILLFFLSMSLKAEVQYFHKGYFDIGTINRLSDGTLIKIPYRMLTYEPTISYDDFYLISSSAIEFRLKDVNDFWSSEFNFDLRELYFEWITSLGEFSIGKQIISWGMASANNPTDNISPYNYYYLFSEGKEQKEGILSFNSTFYFNDWKINAIIIPEHKTNILPFNDSEFAISAPIEIKSEQIEKIKNPLEYALSATFSNQFIDITASYFSGYDRLMSSFGANVWTTGSDNPEILEAVGTIDTVLSYRHTNMFGLGMAKSIDDVSIKLDFGYFITSDNSSKGDSALYRYWQTGIDRILEYCEELNENDWDPQFQTVDCSFSPAFNDSQVIDNRAKYFQYTIELEYAPSFDLLMIGQITISDLLEIGESREIKYSGGSYMFDPEEYFIPGMGAPNTFMSSTSNLLNSKSVTFIVQKSLLDLGVELGYMGFFDLNGKGSLNEFRITYDLTDNLEILGAFNKIKGNGKIENNQFTSMEDFSHFRMEIKYYY